MKITVQCECGNNAIMQILNGKAIVVRDNLRKMVSIVLKMKSRMGKPKNSF